MNNNSNESAYPRGDSMTTAGRAEHPGLTKREYFAGIALQGIISNHIAMEAIAREYKGNAVKGHEYLTKESIRIADELLKQLGEKIG